MPPVLRILWESGLTVVSWGLGLRIIVAVLPFAIAKVAQYIITDIAGVLRGTALPSNFWILVTTEVALNVFLGLITRAAGLRTLSVNSTPLMGDDGTCRGALATN